MNLYHKDGNLYEARQLIGSPVETHQVSTWVATHGNPWLVGNALKPEELLDPCRPTSLPTRGVWIRPEDGALMIRQDGEDVPALIGQYIIRDVLNRFTVEDPETFEKSYTTMEEEV